MKNYIIGLFLVGFVLAPWLSFAQTVGDIDTNPNANLCISLESNNLRYRARDVNTNGEVSLLQDFLQSKNYLNSEPTGYFGIGTLKAVKDLQKDNGINPTGYVGSITKGIIRNATCDGTVITPVKLDRFTGYLKAQENSNTMWGTHSLSVSLDRNCVSAAPCAENMIAKYYLVKASNDVVLEKLKKYENSRVTIYGELAEYKLGAGFWGITATEVKPIFENSKKPIISEVSGPQILKVNETGTWAVKAYDPNGGNLSYSVKWGDEKEIDCAYLDCGMTKQMMIPKQSATFTHSYSEAGNYTAIFTVINTLGESAVASLNINVGGFVLNSELNVVTPNGGEVWVKGENQTINWKDNLVSASMMPTYYDIVLSPYYAPCTSIRCPAVLMPYHAPYVIAQKTLGYSYLWKVGDGTSTGVNDTVVPVGSYTIQICRSGTTICDSSDKYFKIISSGISTPIISGVSGPQTLDVNQTGTWKVSAYDKNGGDLSYYVVWGDEKSCTNGICSSSANAMFSQQSSFTHSYANAGIYTVKFIVKNINETTATTTISVKVE